MSEENNGPISQEELNEQLKERRKKLEELRSKKQAYPNHFKREHYAKDLSESYNDLDKEQLEEKNYEVNVAGRILTRRLMGKASFATIQDTSGKIQIYVQKQQLEDGVYENFKSWDIGDIISVHGTLFKTKTGELSIKANNVQLVTKSLRPLPDKWHGLQDQETKYRQRYVDLMVNEESRITFQKRSQIIHFIREFLVERRFLEVETPMMHVIPGGATARPFVTHHNTLDMELFLRVAPELYLKRLVVGGMERVFEINRNFRNEGMSTKHNPEFTMLEFYEAYATYTDLMDLTEKLLKDLTLSLTGKETITYKGHEIDFGKPFARLSIVDSIVEFNEGITKEQLSSKDGLKNIFQANNIKFDESSAIGKLQFELFEEIVEHKIVNPTFITEYPIEVSPLARRNDERPEVTDRFELFISGKEVANGFSELNDPDDQAERFRKQVEAKDAGDHEAMHYDDDYIRALEYGMPPTAGEGIGIDRLVMIYTDSPTIRDVILFPHMRKK